LNLWYDVHLDYNSRPTFHGILFDFILKDCDSGYDDVSSTDDLLGEGGVRVRILGRKLDSGYRRAVEDEDDEDEDSMDMDSEDMDEV